MAEPKPFAPGKLVCGVMAAAEEAFAEAETRLAALYGPVEDRSPRIAFPGAAYYAAEMGEGLRRGFLSFAWLVSPDRLSAIKLRTTALEEEIRAALGAARRAVNLDPGIVGPASLIMATAKPFAHRIPLQRGIYAHLELLFARDGLRRLDWTYPDFRGPEYEEFFLRVRRAYRRQMR